jgi:hypothetical protein
MGLFKEFRQSLRDVRYIAEHFRQLPARRWDPAANGEELLKALCESALKKSVSIVEHEMPEAMIHLSHEAFLSECLARAPLAGAHCEFGVFSGTSINLLASKRPSQVFDGFDSFNGLPEDWTGYRGFDFDRQGKLPSVQENVRLHVGLFDVTLPAYARACGPVAFLHVDCDLYASTACVFAHLGPLLAPGCVIVFDEYFAYPGFEHHERKAFAEYLRSSGRSARWIACCGQRAACILN